MEFDSLLLVYYMDLFLDYVGDLIYLNGVSDVWIVDLVQKGNFIDLLWYLVVFEDQGYLGVSLGVLMQN